MLALSLAFTDDWIIRWFGSYLQPASITWLSYAKTLMRVPLGVVGQGVGVASFPFLARLYSEGKFDELNRLLNSTLKGLIATLIPISALIIAQSAPVVYLVFSHTRMRPPDLDATAATLVFFTLGLFGWGAQYILARGFYATRNTWIPALIGTALTFVAEKIKAFVFYGRTTDCAPELIGSQSIEAWSREQVLRVQLAIPKIFVSRSVYVFCARLRYRIYD